MKLTQELETLKNSFRDQAKFKRGDIVVVKYPNGGTKEGIITEVYNFFDLQNFPETSYYFNEKIEGCKFSKLSEHIHNNCKIERIG